MHNILQTHQEYRFAQWKQWEAGSENRLLLIISALMHWNPLKCTGKKRSSRRPYPPPGWIKLSLQRCLNKPQVLHLEGQSTTPLTTFSPLQTWPFSCGQGDLLTLPLCTSYLIIYMSLLYMVFFSFVPPFLLAIFGYQIPLSLISKCTPPRTSLNVMNLVFPYP